MLVNRRVVPCALFLGLALSAPRSAQAEPTFRLVPVQPQVSGAPPYPDGTIINGTTILLPGGSTQRLWIELRYSGWGTAGNGMLESLQGQTDPASYSSGAGAPLISPVIACADDPDICDEQIGQHLGAPGVSCQGQQGQVCRVAFQQLGRTDAFPGPGSWISGCHSDHPGLSCGAAAMPYGDSRTDDGQEHYGGTFVVDVPPDAAGTYTITFNEFSFLEYADDSHPALNLIPAEITICDPSQCGGRKNRFLPYGTASAFDASDTPFAIRVKLVDLPLFPASNGQERWLGSPTQIEESPGGNTFRIAPLQCWPFLADWQGVGIADIYGSEIVPDSTYEIRFVRANCLFTGDESCMGPPTIVRTGRWGDIKVPFFAGQPGTEPSFADVAAIVDKFRELPGAPSRLRAKLSGSVPDPTTAVSFSDISAGVSAFQGLPYPYAGPSACP